MDRQSLNPFFDELVKIAEEEIKAEKKSDGAFLHTAEHKFGHGLGEGVKRFPSTKWGSRVFGLRKLFVKGSSYIDDLEAPPSRSLMPAIRRAHGLDKRSSWTEIGPVGQSEGRAWKPSKLPWIRGKLASALVEANISPKELSGILRRKDETRLRDPETGESKTAREWAKEFAGRAKLAEPGPPEGVPLETWDRILQGEAGDQRTVKKLVKKYADQIRAAARKDREKRAYKLRGHVNFQGIPISIENRKGSVRKGRDSDGKEWRTKMRAPYGYITGGPKGADDEPVDVYVGPDKDAPDAYVVHQHKDTGKSYDEDKVILGMKSKAAAKALFLAHYNSPKFLGPISKVSVDRLRELVKSKRKLVKIHE